MNEQKLAEQIGRRFREFRVNQGLRQEEISAVLGTSHTNISRLERGKIRRPSTLFLNSCRAELGLSIDWLVTGQEPMFPAEAEFQASRPRQKGKKGRPGCVSISADQKELQRKHHQLTASLARVTRLVHELFAHARDRDARAKRK